MSCSKKSRQLRIPNATFLTILRMDKNTITGFVLIGIVIFAFSWFNKPTPEQVEAMRHQQDSLARIENQSEAKSLLLEDPVAATFVGESDSAYNKRMEANFGSFAKAVKGESKTTTLENEVLELRISNKGGAVSYARLKQYDNYKGEPIVLFENSESLFDLTLITADNHIINTRDLYFSPVSSSAEKVVMRLTVNANSYLDFVYTLSPDDYRVGFNIQGTGLNGVLSPTTKNLAMQWSQKIRQQEKGRTFEERYVSLYYALMDGEVDYLSETANDAEKIETPLKWIGFKDHFFSSVLIAKEGFEGADLDSKRFEKGTYMKSFDAVSAVPFDIKGEKATELTYFFGPNKFSLLSSYDDELADGETWGLEEIVPLGWSLFRWINKFFIIPIFDFLSNHIGNMGVVILLLTIIVKLLLFPLTRKSYLSSAKMRVLRPQVMEINAKYPDKEQALEKQKEVMDLYSRAGASPMSGCMPMLLQMPILLALFSFFPTAIELRHENFLWANDLSTYDAIISWDAQIPFVSAYFGNHISLFCLLMTITNIIYTKFNMEQTNTGQEQMPGMKTMMYMMPLMMFVFFNQYASGLTYYYFISTLITITQTIVFRYTIDEEKLLAKLEANKRKPQKKSNFMKRLEEAQRMQEEQLKKQKEMRKR